MSTTEQSKPTGASASPKEDRAVSIGTAEGARLGASETSKQPSSGVITAVRGSVVDVRFDDRLPPIRTLLRTGSDGSVAIEVVTQLNAHHVRGIALTPTQGLARGMPVSNTGGPLLTPVGKAILSRAGAPRDRREGGTVRRRRCG